MEGDAGGSTWKKMLLADAHCGHVEDAAGGCLWWQRGSLVNSTCSKIFTSLVHVGLGGVFD